MLSLRYFNPIGADPKMRTGLQLARPTHALGKMIQAQQEGVPFVITGTDWPTRDGTGLRDYVHVWDLAAVHVAALTRFDALPGLATAGHPGHRRNPRGRPAQPVAAAPTLGWPGRGHRRRVHRLRHCGHPGGGGLGQAAVGHGPGQAGPRHHPRRRSRRQGRPGQTVPHAVDQHGRGRCDRPDEQYDDRRDQQFPGGQHGACRHRPQQHAGQQHIGQQCAELHDPVATPTVTAGG